MSILNKAKKLVENYSFPAKTITLMEEFIEDNDCEVYFDGKITRELVSLDRKVLAQAFGYSLMGQIKVKKDSTIPLGASKMAGPPHLPKGLKIPDGYIFHAQLNIRDFKKWDIDKLFPSKGIIYLFEDEDEADDVKVLFFDGPTSKLERRESDGITSSKSHVSSLSFKGHYLFHLGYPMDSYMLKEAARLIPADLKKQLDKLTGGTMAGDSSNWQIFGRPSFWQSEDLEARKSYASDRVLMFQENHGEGNRHYWIKPADLKNKKFSKVLVTYSGT